MLRSALVVLLLLTSSAAFAQKAGDIEITGAWARATPKGAQVGGGYLTIKNTGSAPDRLISGATSVSGKFEVHEMSDTGGVMKMRAVEKGLEIKPGETVELKPGGYHVMFVGLKQPLEQGKPFTATLQFEKAGKVDVSFAVQPIGAPAPGAGGHRMH